MNTAKILASLDTIQAELNKIKAAIDVESATPSTQPATPKKPKLKFQLAESVTADKLGPPPDLKSEAWPEAVMPHMIVTHKKATEKQFRALQVARLVGGMEGQTVLDIGCGEGYVANEIGHQAKRVIGYDIKPFDTWEKLSTEVVNFTTAKGDLEAFRYDTIIAYDVLDHLEGEEPVKFMTWLNSVLAPGGRVFVRTHPWTSKHGGHLYENGCNKAFAHLVLTPDELAQAGVNLPPCFKFTRPMATYESVFNEAGFKISARKGQSEPVDQFVSDELLGRIIKITWKDTIDPASALKIMSNSFIDYTLTAE